MTETNYPIAWNRIESPEQNECDAATTRRHLKTTKYTKYTKAASGGISLIG
jgi:hypothetical protein